jgi:FkbM family methyltransferase
MGDLVLDVGAGRGEDTCVLSAAVGPSGTVVAIEAHPETFTILEDFVRLNELPNVHLEHCAVSDRSGTCLISEEAEELWQCASLKFAGGAGRPVPAKRIDDLPQLAGTRHIAFLKMNIEGAEVVALQGAREILAKTDNICVCCHDFLGEQTRTKVAVEELLARSGFNLLWSPPDSPAYERDFVYGTR